MKKTLNSFASMLLIIGLLCQSCKKEGDENPLDKSKPYEMPCDYLQTERVLKNDPDKPIDYVVNCVMFVDGRITVEPGTVIMFNDETGLKINTSGSLNAVGTSESQIVFTSRSKSKGAWKGIAFSSSNVNNRLEHCIIEYAGGSAFDSNDDRASVILFPEGRLSLNHVIIREALNYGISMEYQEANIEVKNCKIHNSGKAPVIGISKHASVLDNTTDFSGNSLNRVEFYSSVMSGMELKKLNVPYFFKNRPFGSNFIIGTGVLKINPGVEIIMDDGTNLVVEVNGALDARGLPSDRIVFTGLTKASGSWKGIYYNQSTSINNFITECIIEYAGDGSDDAKGAITLWNNPRLMLANSEFRNLSNCAVYDFSGPDNPNLIIQNISLVNVAGGAELCWD